MSDIVCKHSWHHKSVKILFPTTYVRIEIVEIGIICLVYTPILCGLHFLQVILALSKKLFYGFFFIILSANLVSGLKFDPTNFVPDKYLIWIPDFLGKIKY